MEAFEMGEIEFYKTMLEGISVGIYFVDLERKITFWNKGAELISGFTAEEMLGKHCYDNMLNHVDDEGNKLCLTACPLHFSMEDGKIRRHNSLYLHHKEGYRVRIKTQVSPIYNNGKIVGCAETFVEAAENNTILDYQNCSTDELKLLALYDQLTGLPNRRYLESFMKSRLNDFKELLIPFAVLFMDIDDFRLFNNNYGHEVGDRVLRVISKTYVNAIRKSDAIGRWGGEEFLGIFPGVNEAELTIVAEKIRMLVENSIIRKGGQEHRVTVSIGGTIIKKEDDLKSLVNRADMLMYQSKKSGKNKITIG